MVTVKILGVGCSRCKALEKKVRELVEKNDIQADISKIEEISEIMTYGIMMTPGLVINEKVKSSGTIPNDQQILSWLNEG